VRAPQRHFFLNALHAHLFAVRRLALRARQQARAKLEREQSAHVVLGHLWAGAHVEHHLIGARAVREQPEEHDEPRTRSEAPSRSRTLIDRRGLCSA
jgi:hypothetical protein